MLRIAAAGRAGMADQQSHAAGANCILDRAGLRRGGAGEQEPRQEQWKESRKKLRQEPRGALVCEVRGVRDERDVRGVRDARNTRDRHHKQKQFFDGVHARAAPIILADVGDSLCTYPAAPGAIASPR